MTNFDSTKLQLSQALLNDECMDRILQSHCIQPETLRTDDFNGFYRKRKQALLDLIEVAMGKQTNIKLMSAEDEL